MFNKSDVKDEASSEGRVLGRILSREEVLSVSGGAEKPKTDSWKDDGVSTPKSDPPSTSAPSIE